MNRKLVLTLALTLLIGMLNVAFKIQPAEAGGTVGVKAGDWIKCTYTISGWPSGTPYPEWLKGEFLSVEGTNVTVRVTMHMSDGTEQNATVPVDVVAGGQALGLSGFVIPANLTTGDSVYITGYGNITITDETTRTYAGASRTVVFASFSQYGTQLTYYWDKLTGVMVEASVVSGGVTATSKATETNMWQAETTETIYIRADGSVDPSDAPISTVDNVTYTFTGNITSDADGIVVERSNIAIDGKEYALQGSGSGDGFDLTSVSNVTIKNINIKNFYYGIWLRESSNNSIVQNNLISCSGAVDIEDASNNEIVENNIEYREWGVRLSHASNNTLRENNITGIFYPYSTGVYLYASSFNSITQNTIKQSVVGIELVDSSVNRIDQNIVSTTTDWWYGETWGISLSSSTLNIISQNNITENSYGLRIAYSYPGYRNAIYHNNFVNNIYHAQALNFPDNVWDIGYPSGGNYWSDYNGTDLLSGPYQNETGGDGIGDAPYVIDENNLDNYPLMEPWSPIPTVVIYIRANGSVDPADAPIQREGDIYTLTEDIYGSIVVERDDVVVDGTGYVLHGTGKETGVKLSGRNNVTIENMEIEAFHTGVIISDSSNNKLYENNITNNLYSIRLYQSSNNSMSGNNITASVFISIWLENSSDIVLCRNNVFANWFGLAVQGSSRNVVNENEIAENDQDGISLYSSSGNTISGNKIVKNNGYAVQIYSSSGNTISGNKIVKNNGYAVQIYSSSDNAISGNVVSENGGGIDLRSSSNNLFSRNNITVNKGYGIIVSGSSQVISGNIIDGNEYNLDISGDLPSHSIDISNLVDGKSVYYLVNKKNMVINPSTHPQVGYLALINCINITVQGLTLKDNGQGLLISNTNNSKIEGNNITNNWEGIRLDSSSNNSVSENNITNNYEAIVLMSSSNNSVSGNNITNNSFGVDLPDSSNNSVIGNNITANNYTAITLLESGNNAIFHNDFIDNTKQVFDYAWENPDILPSINVWDDGYPSGGNYWSDYAGVDSDPGGIGDTPYIIDANNTDRYPLMAPISLFDARVWNGIAYNVDVVSNSTVSGFYFNPDEGSFLRFNVTGEDGRTGFCRVTIPKDLLWVDDGWTIFVGGEPITDYKTIPDENYTYLYFTYNHTTKTVEIQGTHVIPEFTSFAILPLLMIFTIFAVASVKKRLPRKPQT